MNNLNSIFTNKKPIIAMAHLPPLPGTPLYDNESGISGIIQVVEADLDILTKSGFDAIMFCNEGDRPYTFHAGYSGVATMTRVITELAPNNIPFGVDFLWDAQAALAIAVATGASFIREVISGVYESDMGIWNTDAGALLRERRRLDAGDLAVFMNIAPEFASQIGSRDLGQIARSTIVSSIPDAILVSGLMAGEEPSLEDLRVLKQTIGDDIPVFVNTGTKSRNIKAFLEIADGAIVGSDLKYEGYTWNTIDPERVERFIKAAGR
jgi:membrane complex biogenesis BtpA family protein